MEGLRVMLGRSHELVQLITQCLDYSPSARPTASEALDRLQQISSSIQDIYHSMTRLQLENALMQSDSSRQDSEVARHVVYWICSVPHLYSHR